MCDKYISHEVWYVSWAEWIGTKHNNCLLIFLIAVPEDENEPSEKQKKATLDQHNNIVAQYKELIREQACTNVF